MYVLLRDLRKYSSLDRSEGRFGRGTVRDSLKALVLWVIEGEGHSDAPFPFSLPHLNFAQRCLQAGQRAEPWVGRPRTAPERRALACLERIVARLDQTPRFASTVRELGSRWTAFCELRDVLRLSNAELPRGDTRTTQEHLPALELVRLQQIKQAVDQYTTDLNGCIAIRRKQAKKSKSAAEIILGYLQQYGPYLFGHPAKLDEQGGVIAVVQRTNNVSEHFFGRQKQMLRRRVGRGQLGRDLEKQPAQVALVANLRDPEYVRRLAGSLDKLPTAFAQLDQETPGQVSMLIRDHRNSQLQRVLRQLLKDQPLPIPYESEQEPRRNLVVPCMQEFVDSAQEMIELPDEEIRSRTTVQIAQRPQPPPKPRDPRLPPPGSLLERRYAGRTYHIKVLENGLRYRHTTYSSPTKLVHVITGNSHNGFDFLGLTVPWPERAAQLQGRRMNRATMIDLPIPTES
jgi:hypothetical protein